MSENKYHTIDPLILETLNLNEQRMNHILNIIHGKEERVSYARTERRLLDRSRRNHHTVHATHDDSALPPILVANPKVKQIPPGKEERRASQRLKQNRSKEEIMVNQSADKSRTVEKSEKGEGKERRYERQFKSQRKMKAERTVPQEEIINIEQQVHKHQQHKRQQLMKDYMMNKLKKSKSQPLNPKDVYRFQMESMVAEMTPIEELEEVEKRMQRLKKRHRHLVVFDKNYYTKLNQQDLINLS